MIISASRRTDIPSYFSDWFYNRIKEKYVLVRNPMNIHQVSKINLSADVIDGIVFWTKNPIPMIERLYELKNYIYYFQFTLNSYGKDIEPNIPSKNDFIIPAFQELSKKIGKDRVIWRYDPILFNEKYTIDYHIQYFKAIASKLCQYTEKCTVSFIDMYRSIERNVKSLKIIFPSSDQKFEMMQRFSEIANDYGIYIDTCAEDIELSQYGIKHAQCIDKKRFEQIGKYNLSIEKDKNQRAECGCMASVDIGMYDTCKNGCLYCYANHNLKTVQNNFELHNKTSPLISGEVGKEDNIKKRKIKSCKNCQLDLFS